MKTKKTLTIIYGGPGDEHPVSIKSAMNIINNIDTKKYELHTIFISKAGKWIMDGREKNMDMIFKTMKEGVVWPILHGEFGEDGKLQKILESKKIKFIGSDSSSSKITMSKDATQKVLKKNNIKYPKSILLTKYKKDLGIEYPIIVKPDSGGSSFGLFKFDNQKDYDAKIKGLLKKYKKVLIQEFVVGREFTCGVIEMGKRVVALPVSEVVLTKTALFDYEAKYTKGGCLEVTPAKIDDKLSRKIQSLAVNVHKLLGCSDLSRTDMIMNGKGELVVLEINTAPGMTETSFIPQELEAKNIKITTFIDAMIANNIK